MKRAFERFMGRLLAGRHAGDENLLARAPGLAEVAATIELTSPAFGAGGPIPTRYTQEGDDRFPPLTWRGVPAAAQELVIVVEDPDAPLPRPVVHAIIHGLSARAEGLDEAEVNAPGFAGFGRNSRGARNYRGPRPILGHGPHRYVFQLFALQQPLRLAGPPTKKALRAALSGGGVLARGELVGTYERHSQLPTANTIVTTAPKPGMRLASAVTLINVLVAAGFSIIGLVRPDLIVPAGTTASGASAIFAMYAAARAIPLAVAVVLAVLSRSPVALLILGTLAGTVQGLDAIIGIIHHDAGKTIGPLILAVAQGYAMLVLRKRMRSAP